MKFLREELAIMRTSAGTENLPAEDADAEELNLSDALLAVAMTACRILNAILIGLGVKLTLDAFSEFRASRENKPA